MIDLSIIIVTYNSASYIPKLLSDIKSSKDNLKKEVIVIDNSSADNSAFIARNHPLKPLVLTSAENVGFARAVNQGIKNSTGKFVLLLNPDSSLIGSCLQYLYDFAFQTSPLGAVVPQILNYDGKPQPSVMNFPTICNAIKHYFFYRDDCFGKYLPNKEIDKVPVAVMAAFLIPRTTIDKVGLLDEKYFLYYEDVEYCRRLKKHRLPIYYLKKAKIKHAHGASGNFKSHLASPLAKSAVIYHGRLYSNLLNLTLFLGQKFQKVTKLFPKKSVSYR